MSPCITNDKQYGRILRHYVWMVLVMLAGMPQAGVARSKTQYDIVVYGGTSAGIAAAIQAHRMGKSVVLIEPTQRLGGLTTGGLGQTDIGNKQAIGGISREFYQRMRAYYDQPDSWKWQKKEEYKDGGQTTTEANEDAMWTFEPSAALKIYHQMLEPTRVKVVYGQRLNRVSGVKKKGTGIVSIAMESGETYAGRMFIDATYEGDLMAAAGVKYAVGREANQVYQETLNGVQANTGAPSLKGEMSINGKNHNLVDGVDPYVRRGDPASGLLPFIDPNGPGKDGEGDKRIQAYCYRICITDHPDNRIPFEKPPAYAEADYELLFRNYEAGYNKIPWINAAMPNRKTDINNRDGFSSDFIGQNYDYPEASYAEREKMAEGHRRYQQGLMWTLANHPRIPEQVRREVSRWGMCKDEFTEGSGWQEQLYVREARRMVSNYVITQHDCEGLRKAEDAVGLAAYGMDSHHMQRYVDQHGQVKNEGNVQAAVGKPFPVSYRAIVPRKEECNNLLVPVCLSASHIAFGSVRMEPVFMVLGQSAATAAALAIEAKSSLQDLPYAALQQRLLQDGQRLENR